VPAATTGSSDQGVATTGGSIGGTHESPSSAATSGSSVSPLAQLADEAPGQAFDHVRSLLEASIGIEPIELGLCRYAPLLDLVRVEDRVLVGGHLLALESLQSLEKWRRADVRSIVGWAIAGCHHVPRFAGRPGVSDYTTPQCPRAT